MTTTIVRAALVALLLSSGVARVATAQQFDETSQRDVGSAYDQAIAEAVGAYERGDNQAALRAFTAAHALSPNARTHRGLGIVLFALGDFAGAMEHLDAALMSSTVPLDDALREQTRQVRDAAAQRQAAITQAATPEDAPSDVAPDEQADPVPEAGNTPPSESTPAPADPSPPLGLELDEPARAPTRTPRPHVAWILAGASYGATALSVVPWAIGRARLNSLSAWCRSQPAGGCTPEQRDAEWDARGIDTQRRAARGLAIAGATSALVLSIVAWRRGRARPLSVGVNLLEPGAELRIRF